VMRPGPKSTRTSSSPDQRSNRQGRDVGRRDPVEVSLLHILSDPCWAVQPCAIVQVTFFSWQGTSLVWGWSVHDFFPIQSGPRSKTQTAQLSDLAKSRAMYGVPGHPRASRHLTPGPPRASRRHHPWTPGRPGVTTPGPPGVPASPPLDPPGVPAPTPRTPGHPPPGAPAPYPWIPPYPRAPDRPLVLYCLEASRGVGHIDIYITNCSRKCGAMCVYIYTYTRDIHMYIYLCTYVRAVYTYIHIYIANPLYFARIRVKVLFPSREVLKL